MQPSSMGLAIENRNETAASVKYHVFDRVCVMIDEESKDAARNIADQTCEHFRIDSALSYIGFCDDFGPMSLGSIHHFCAILGQKLEELHTELLALHVQSDPRAITNAVFLTGAYMIMKRNDGLDYVQSALLPLMNQVVPYRDVSPGKQNFNLLLQDCLGGMIRAKKLGWILFNEEGFDADQYVHLDDPLNADMHEIVPGKFIAMRGPKELPKGRLWMDTYHEDGTFSHRDFSPNHYADILQQFDVKMVVRLNSKKYRKEEFEAAGISVTDLFFEDCSVPSTQIVTKFLNIVEHVPGAIAVHCKAGLGRTGTLIAVYMMRHHGFTAREAMGWIRIVRPGSIIGEQQDFLCALQPLLHNLGSLQTIEYNITAPHGETNFSADMTELCLEDTNARVMTVGDLNARTLSSLPNELPADQRKALAAHVVMSSSRRSASRFSPKTFA